METLGFGANGWGGQLLAGTLLTIELALTTLPFGFALGLGLALMKNARSKLLRAIGEGFTTAFRGLITHLGGDVLPAGHADPAGVLAAIGAAAPWHPAVHRQAEGCQRRPSVR